MVFPLGRSWSKNQNWTKHSNFRFILAPWWWNRLSYRCNLFFSLRRISFDPYRCLGIITNASIFVIHRRSKTIANSKSRIQSIPLHCWNRFDWTICRLQPITAHVAQLALTAQVLPQCAACALHLVYAVTCGAKFHLTSEEYIDSLSTIFIQSECDVRLSKITDERLSHRCSLSFDFHFLTVFWTDWSCWYLISFKRWVLSRDIDTHWSRFQEPQKSIGSLIDSGLFYILWQQVRAAFRSLNPVSMEENMAAMTTPDWILISRDGIHQLLQLTLELFLQVNSHLPIVIRRHVEYF